MICPVCKSEVKLNISNLYDDRYGYPGNFNLLKCSFCGHRHLKANFSDDELSLLYSTYYPRSLLNLNEYQPYSESVGFHAWLDGARSAVFRWVPKNVTILDIGCGFGESLGYHHSRGCNVYGVEVDQNIKRVAEKYGYKVHIGLFESKHYQAEFFDFVTMSQVLEHVTNPIQVVSGIAEVLKSGGVAIISTPNPSGWGAKFFGKKWINWHVPYHLHFFSKNSMELVAKEAGMVLEKVETITPSEWLHLQWLHLVFMSESGNKSALWNQVNVWTFKQAAAHRFLSVIHMLKINHIVTRVFDFLRIGDNRIYVLRKI